MKTIFSKFCLITPVASIALFLSACSNMPSMSSFTFPNQNNQTPTTTQKTRASSYLYFNQLEDNQKTVYIDIVNSANTTEFNIEPFIASAIQRKGYNIIHNIDQANVVIRANLVRVGNFTDEETSDIRHSEFGNSAPKISLTKPEDINGALNYGAIIDLQAFERSIPITPKLDQPTEISSNINTSNDALLTYSNSMDWDRFQTRIITQELNTEQPQETVLHDLGDQIEQAFYDIIKD